MFQTVAEITINRPVEEVFAFIADNQNDPHTYETQLQRLKQLLEDRTD